MEDILWLVVLGAIAGAVSCFWTRIIKKGMIFEKIGKQLRTRKSKSSPWVKFIKCVFCIQVWIALVFDLWYIIVNTPHLIPALIGVFASFGAGNLIAEEIHSLRNE